MGLNYQSGQPVRMVGMVVDETELVETQLARDRLVSVMETTLAMSSGCAGSYGVAAGSLAAMALLVIFSLTYWPMMGYMTLPGA